jgi:hypothetical protein
VRGDCWGALYLSRGLRVSGACLGAVHSSLTRLLSCPKAHNTKRPTSQSPKNPEEYWRPGPDGNDIQKTNVPNLRMRFRLDTYQDETRLVLGGAVSHHARKQAALAARGD